MLQIACGSPRAICPAIRAVGGRRNALFNSAPGFGEAVQRVLLPLFHFGDIALKGGETAGNHFVAAFPARESALQDGAFFDEPGFGVGDGRVVLLS